MNRRQFTKYALVAGSFAPFFNNAIANESFEQRKIKAKTATSDETNIRKVSGKRIDAAIIDTNVFNYLLANTKNLAKAKDKVQMNSRLLTNKELFVAFKQNKEGKRWLNIYNQGLKKIDVNAVMNKYLK